MTLTGIDVAWARPTVAEIKAAGAHWVARYFSTDDRKDLHASEVTAYHAAGLGIVTVWETTAGRALAGRAAGIADAKAAEAQRKAVGLPGTHVHHFAVDQDAAWASVVAYFDGVISVLGLARVGAYGGLRVIEGAHGHGIRYLWQTVAWSGGAWSAHATIRQPGGTTLHGGADWDTAMVPDFGQYPRPVAPPKPPKPPAPKPAPTLLEDDMLAYINIPANADVDIPVEPAGTVQHPGGGARNGPMWISAAPQGADATLVVTEHTAHGWGKPQNVKVTVAGPRWSMPLPADGSVDKVRIHSTVPLLAYVVGRQVA
jgi:hypothetical protein